HHRLPCPRAPGDQGGRSRLGRRPLDGLDRNQRPLRGARTTGGRVRSRRGARTGDRSPTGGSFGGKHGDEAIEAARLARAVGCPGRVHWSRAEEFRWGYLRPMAVIDIRAGLDTDGSITAWDFLDINAGAPGMVFPYTTASRRLRYQPSASPLAQGP